MPKVSQQVTVHVSDKGIEEERRHVHVSINANGELFRLSDMLVKEGAIQELESVLKASMRRAVAEYISSGRKFVRGVSTVRRRTTKSIGANAEQDKRIAVHRP